MRKKRIKRKKVAYFAFSAFSALRTEEIMGHLLDQLERFVAHRSRGKASTRLPTPVSGSKSTVSHAAAGRDRSFLPRPRDSDGTDGFWDEWSPFMDRLIIRSAERFHAICDAEDALHRLEKRGVTTGETYDLACEKLCREFEHGRRFMRSQTGKNWWQ